MSKQQKVLIFDSGVGGISVYQEIQKLLPQLDYLYIFDNEAYPYGELEHETLIKRVRCLVTKLVAEYQIDLVVIACNTASTIVLPTLRQSLSIPVVGVVPAIKPASNLASKAVGLIATPATVTRQYTKELIRDFAQSKTVEMLGSTRLVDIAEEKLRGMPVSLSELQKILSPLADNIDVAVLGCTHFPLIRDEIQAALGEHVILIDSGEAIARRVQDLLKIDRADKIGGREIFSSAPPWEEEALNNKLMALGFNPIRHYPILDF
ncbi:glutamate racemase [Vibrio sp. TRT 21S02]|uniref:glutamate racemase n=1 Tax=Vibrio sp. TRT 21S02 TaxID=3418507 RepID=UPI003CE945C3